MVVTRFDPVYLGVGAVAILVGVLHYRLSQRAAWAGAIVPLLCAGLTGWLVATGRIQGFVELVALILGFAALAAYWRQARNVARARVRADPVRPAASPPAHSSHDRTPAPAASPHQEVAAMTTSCARYRTPAEIPTDGHDAT